MVVFMAVTSVARFERFFRLVAGLDIDKDDLRRYQDFIDRKVRDLLVVGEAAAGANGRDIMLPSDLPVTKGLQQSIHDFEEVEAELQLGPILDRLTPRPYLRAALEAETDARLPKIVGGLSVALAHTFKLVYPNLKNPSSAHWECAFRIFDQLL
jgi:hypothetical protein